MVEATDKLEGSTPTEAGDEEERVVCPVCGEIFNQSGYKLIVHAFVTQQPIPASMEEQGQEAPKMDVRDAEMILGIEKGESDQLQSQLAKEGKSYWKDGESPQVKLQQREVVDKHGVDTQEPASLSILVEVATQIGEEELEAENIPDFNEEVYAVTPKPS